MVRPASGPAPNQSALAALLSDTLQSCANEIATPSGTKRTHKGLETPSGEAMVQRACDGAAAAIHDLANAPVSADLLAHAKTLTDVLLALRAPETRHAALR